MSNTKTIHEANKVQHPSQNAVCPSVTLEGDFHQQSAPVSRNILHGIEFSLEMLCLLSCMPKGIRYQS